MGWVMPASAAWNAGVRRGDRLPDGRPVPGTPVQVVTAQRGPILLNPERPRLPGRAEVAMLIGGGLVLLVAGSILVRGRGSRAAVALAAPVLAIGLILSVAPATSASRAWALVLMFGGILALGPVFLHACRPFVRPTGRLLGFWRACWGILSVLVVGGLVADVLAIATGGVAYPVARLLDDVCLTVGFLTGTLLVLGRLLRQRFVPDPLAPAALLLGTALGLLPLIAFLDGSALFRFKPGSPELATIGLLLLPASYAYAVQRHRLPGLLSIWNRRLARATGAALLAALYLLLFDILLVHLAAAAAPVETLPFALGVFALGVSVVPIARAAAYCTDRTLFHDAYSRHDTIRQLVEAIGTAADVRPATAEALRDVRRRLNLRWLAVFIRQNGRWTLTAADAERDNGGTACLGAALAAYDSPERPPSRCPRGQSWQACSWPAPRRMTSPCVAATTICWSCWRRSWGRPWPARSFCWKHRSGRRTCKR
ncbi:MAG: hypothetical protein ACR2JY_14725 [Chloroflexota bacterium]